MAKPVPSGKERAGAESMDYTSVRVIWTH